MLHEGRVLTKKLAMETCRRLRKKFGLSMDLEVEEVNRLHALLKQARKRQLGKVSVVDKAMSCIDTAQTLPMDMGFAQDLFFF